MFNASATLNVGRLAYNPSLCLPHLAVASFDKIPVPVTIANADIKALVLDKDNCFAKDHDDKVWPAYTDAWNKLLQTYPKLHLLIVSNSAGTNDDIDHAQATRLEESTGVTVLRHSTKKPGCHHEILQYFAKHDIKAHQIAVVGDRLFTDMLMANMMGSWGVWLSEGVELSNKIFVKLERQTYALLTGRGFVPPTPSEE